MYVAFIVNSKTDGLSSPQKVMDKLLYLAPFIPGKGTQCMVTLWILESTLATLECAQTRAAVGSESH